MTLATMVDGHWLPVKDGDDRARALYLRHYSANPDRQIGNRSFAGLGQKLVLLTVTAQAVFIWRRDTLSGAELKARGYPRQSGEDGVCCSLFRNESAIRSSDLIREAMDLAWRRWPGERLFTYVNPSKIRSTNPGYCFKQAGWKTCGMSKGGLVILEVLP